MPCITKHLPYPLQATPAGPDGPEVEYNKSDTSNPHFVAYGKVNKKKVKKAKKKVRGRERASMCTR